jgi:4-hydroxybenzoate polyprenyltransferase
VSVTTQVAIPRLAWDMLRYRVAVMMWMFMLLGAAFHGVRSWPLDDLAALTVAIAAGYVVATTVNDIADEDIDRINNLAGRGRPLVHGQATPVVLWRLNVAAAVVALVAGAYVGWRGGAVVATSLLIAYAYSIPPLRISHRALWAAPVLTLAYVLGPYLHGLALADSSPTQVDLLFAGGLCALFLARIVLKDFRDRAGDTAAGKQTLLSRYGKGATCRASLVALWTGCVLVSLALRSVLMAAIVVAFGLAIAGRLQALKVAATSMREQVAIGIAARMGNGLLVCLLGWMLLSSQSAPAVIRDGFPLALGALYGFTHLTLVLRPDEVLVGYKG